VPEFDAEEKMPQNSLSLNFTLEKTQTSCQGCNPKILRMKVKQQINERKRRTP
jgi:hypothetical protein